MCDNCKSGDEVPSLEAIWNQTSEGAFSMLDVCLQGRLVAGVRRVLYLPRQCMSLCICKDFECCLEVPCCACHLNKDSKEGCIWAHPKPAKQLRSLLTVPQSAWPVC